MPKSLLVIDWSRVGGLNPTAAELAFAVTHAPHAVRIVDPRAPVRSGPWPLLIESAFDRIYDTATGRVLYDPALAHWKLTGTR